MQKILPTVVFSRRTMKQHWVSDGQTTHCYSCNSQFTQINRRHHCRLCGFVYCAECSSRRLSVPELNIDNQRFCDSCFYYRTKHLPFLIQEKRFLRYEKNDKQFFVWVSVSTDEKSLKIRYDQNERTKKELSLNDFNIFQDGQNTPLWFSYTQSSGCCGGASQIVAEESKCFSVCFGAETLDLKADSEVSKNNWVEAFQAFMTFRKSRAAEFVDSERDRVQQLEKQKAVQEREEKREGIEKKYDKIRTDIGKKYTKV